jgi:hypothetical protein
MPRARTRTRMRRWARRTAICGTYSGETGRASAAGLRRISRTSEPQRRTLRSRRARFRPRADETGTWPPYRPVHVASATPTAKGKVMKRTKTAWRDSPPHSHSRRASSPSGGGRSQQRTRAGRDACTESSPASRSRGNTVTGNHPTSDAPILGGVVLASATSIGGAEPTKTVVSGTGFRGNQPADLVYDGSGMQNRLAGNRCGTSVPDGPAADRDKGLSRLARRAIRRAQWNDERRTRWTGSSSW